MKRAITVGSLLALALFLGACSKHTSDVPGDVHMVSGHHFDPSTITVKAGDTVTFGNASAESHTVTAYQDSIPPGGKYFSSGGAASEKDARGNLGAALIQEGSTFSVTLDTPGTYRYFCIPHESDGMKGTIVVTP
jgi:plastocyanin